MSLENYTTEALEADIAKWDGTMTPGPANQARHLLLLDTPERRHRASQEGDTLVNLAGGRPSDCVGSAVRALLRLIKDGLEERELYGERVARKANESVNAQKESWNYLL